jgi:hypothetical protein
MNLIRETFLLFCLNLLDALLTIIWVRNGAAEEANGLMAKFLDMGDLAFLSAKLAVGTFAAIVFLYGSRTSFAKYALGFVIAIYLCLMGIHLATGIAAFEIVSQETVDGVRISFASLFLA